MKNSEIVSQKNHSLTFFLLSTFPISLILGNLIINIYFLLFSISFFVNFNENKKFIINKINFLLIFFFLSLLVNVFFSTNWVNSLPRAIKTILIILFIVEVQKFVINSNKNRINLLFKYWSIILLILIIDINYEFIKGKNLIGFSSIIPGRIASFFGDELVVGGFFHGFILFFISYIAISYPKKKLFLALSIIFLIYVSFIIGERTNFLKVFICVIIFSILTFKVSLFKKITSLILIFLIFALIINFNKNYKYRYYNQIENIYKNGHVNFFLKNTQYGAHQITAYEIFKNYPLFGVGIKNFMSESYKDKYNNNNPSNNSRVATHPHQIHLEFLSETGLFGYMSFLFFIISTLILAIKKYLKSKNFYLLSSTLYLISILLPIIPSGSFLSTYNGAIFWINFSIMSSFILKKY